MPPKSQIKSDPAPAEVEQDEQTPLCKEHFPLGWDSVAASNWATKKPYPAVTCEHGHWKRPEEVVAQDETKLDGEGWRLVNPDGEVVASGALVEEFAKTAVKPE